MAEKRKITCKSFLEEMSDYIDGDLPQDLRASLESHLAKCPECWVLVDETRQTVEIVQKYDCHPLPAEVKGRLVDALQKHWEKS
jgi:anti-sigma factor (TIGR02949 family)